MVLSVRKYLIKRIRVGGLGAVVGFYRFVIVFREGFWGVGFFFLGVVFYFFLSFAFCLE